MRRSLPVINAQVAPDTLDLVEIPIPCQVPWDSMPGDEQVRHCGQCKQNVYNVSALTRAEAIRLLSARACLRIYRRPDNTVLTSDCRARLRAARKKGVLIFAGTLLIVLWAQICAQFVGLMGLRWLFGGEGGATMGEPVSVPMPGQLVAPPPPPAIMGVPPMAETLLPPRPSKTMDRGRHTAGKPVPHRFSKPVPKMGKIAIDVLED